MFWRRSLEEIDWPEQLADCVEMLRKQMIRKTAPGGQTAVRRQCFILRVAVILPGSVSREISSFPSPAR